jgi:ParB-like chromosome segregation protein Spo0J
MSLKPITIKVNPKYANAVAQMNPKSFEQLKRSIDERGLEYTIKVNRDYVLLDGHNRFRACQELNRPITEDDIEVKHFKDSLDEEEFVTIINTIRRHLTPYQQAEAVYKIEQIEMKRAALRQSEAGKLYGRGKVGHKNDSLSSCELKLQEEEERGQARDIAIKKVGATISSATYTRAKKIMDSPEITEQQKQKLRENKTKINTIFQALQSKEIREELVRQASSSPKLELPTGSKLICDDFRKYDGIPDNSIDLIFTDPPYAMEFIPLFKDLGKLAARVLKKNGSLVTFCGQLYLDECMDQIKQGSNYEMKWLWPVWVKHAGQHCFMKFPGLRVWAHGKPLLWFTKGEKRRAEPVRATPDFIESKPPNKVLHEWSQSTVEAEHMIDVCTVENQIVLDPFLGAGTSGIAALKLNRKFIGIEVDSERFKVAEANIANSINSRGK